MNQQSPIERIVNSKFYPLLLFFVSFVFVTLFSRSTSFLYVFEGGDPSVFKQMGLSLLRGKTLYVDYFDNKGCILYFIHAFCLWLGGDFFILLMQTFSLTITLIIWDKMLALYRNEKERVCCLGIALIMLLCFYSAGDQTQEWCLPFISYPLLIYFRAYKTKTEVTFRQMFIIGLCFGIITFIQINNACAFLGFVAYLWIQYLQKKDFKRLVQSIGCFILGWLTIAIPCVLYFYIKAGWHGVYEMVYASFLSNLEYLNSKLRRRRLMFIMPYTLFLLSYISLQLVNSSKEKGVIIPILISFVLFVITFGKLFSMYYLMAFLPFCLVGMMTFNYIENRKTKTIFLSISLICIAYYACGPTLHFINDLVLHKEKEILIYENFHHCIENIPENERDSIYNYNLKNVGTSMMHHENLLQCNRVLFTSLTFYLPTLWREETAKPFIPPKWFLITPNRKYNKYDYLFILNSYDLVCSFHYEKLYIEKPRIGEEMDIHLYRRKDPIPTP